MTNNTDNMNTAAGAATWQLNALTEALGDLTLMVSDSLSVGRGSDNDVVLGSKQVSRNHAVLSVLDGQLYVKDLDSSNGTFINDQRIEGNESSHLKADDTLGFASFSFQVQASASPEENARVTEEGLVTAASTDTEIVDEHSMTDDTIDQSALDKHSALDSRTVIDELVTEETIIEEQVNESSVAASSEPVDKETGIEEILPATDSAESVPVEPSTADSSDMTEAPVSPTEEAVEPAIEEQVVEQSVSEQPITEKPASTDSVVKETGIDEVLSDADAASTMPVKESPVATEVVADAPDTATETEAVTTTVPSPTAPTDKAPLVEEPIAHEEPVVHKEAVHKEAVHKEAMHEEPAVSNAHDKTTKTELQEEADPEVLKAKQAASAQFSGTANLGQARDLGTKGNNAMDQEISNPAHAGHVEKKASGGWFIWVFVSILIIGLALWLFNMGGA